eukprot:5251727-Amphidinium_carterae.1
MPRASFHSSRPTNHWNSKHTVLLAAFHYGLGTLRVRRRFETLALTQKPESARLSGGTSVFGKRLPFAALASLVNSVNMSCHTV